MASVKSKSSTLWSYKQQSRATFAKANNLWNKQNRSTQVADSIKECFGVYLVTPNETRWNSTYDSITFLLNHIKVNFSKCVRLCDSIGVVRFKKEDIEFMEDYVTIMEPLAVALDILQGEKNMYFGFLLPTISILLSKYDDLLTKKRLNYCATLINIIKTSIETRFRKEQADKFLVIAALSHPYFKTLWINNNIIKDLAVANFKEAVLKKSKSEGIESSNIDDENIENTNTHSDETSSFFSWSKMPSNSNISIENEVSSFLNKSPTKNLLVLEETSNIKKVFIEHNTPLPSSASVERIFSVSNAILTKRRGRITDDHFEKVMFLKCNKF